MVGMPFPSRGSGSFESREDYGNGYDRGFILLYLREDGMRTDVI